jgi:hypothetical protein
MCVLPACKGAWRCYMADGAHERVCAAGAQCMQGQLCMSCRGCAGVLLASLQI